MATFIITSYTNSFEISKDGHTKEYQRGVLSYDDDPDNNQIFDINTTQSRQQLYRIDLTKDTLDIDGVTVFADSDAIKIALRPFFFRSVGGGTDSDEFVKASSTDTTPDYLLQKLVSLDGSISIALNNPGLDENINIQTVGGGGGGGAIYETTIYVSSNGDDVTGTRNDTSKPFATIGAAHNEALNGDSIIVYPGTYTVGSNQITKSVQIFAPYGEVTINSFSSTNCINDSGGAIDFKMIGNIRWISTREPLQAGTQTGTPIWSFTNASSEVYIDVEYCQAFRMRVHRLTGSFFKINSSLRFYIEPANLTNTQFKLGDSHNFGWVDDVFNIGNMQGVVVGPVGGRAKLTKDNSFNQGATFNRHKSVIYQGNGGGTTPAATFSSDVTFVNFDVNSPRNTIQCNPHMNYTFENCLFETDRSSGGGLIFINLGGSLAPFNKKLTLNNCRWRSLVGGAIGLRAQFNATSGAAETRFLGTNTFQVTGADPIAGVVAAGTYDLNGQILSNRPINPNMTNNIVGTAAIIDANITVK